MYISGVRMQVSSPTGGGELRRECVRGGRKMREGKARVLGNVSQCTWIVGAQGGSV